MLVAALAVAVLRARTMGRMAVGALRMTLRPAVAGVALLTVVPAIGLERRAVRPLGPSLDRRLEALERLGAGHEVRRQRQERQALARGALDIAQVAALIGGAESNGDAVGAGARGAADAVDILFRNVRQVEVHDMADARDIDPARGDVGRDQHPRFTRPERRKRTLPLGLALVAVDRDGGNAGSG